MPHIQHSVHHPGHRDLGPRTNRKKRRRPIALAQSRHNKRNGLVFQISPNPFWVFFIHAAQLCRQNFRRWNGHAHAMAIHKVKPLPAQAFQRAVSRTRVFESKHELAVFVFSFFHSPTLRNEHENRKSTNRSLVSIIPQPPPDLHSCLPPTVKAIRLRPDLDALNFGVGGNTTNDLARRLDPALQSRPDIVSLLIGTNDLALDSSAPSTIAANVDEILGVIRSTLPKTHIILHSVMPRPARWLDDITELAHRYRDVAAKHGVTFLDLRPTLAGDDGALRPDLTTDGTHLTPRGYEAWLGILTPVIRSAAIASIQQPSDR